MKGGIPFVLGPLGRRFTVFTHQLKITATVDADPWVLVGGGEVGFWLVVPPFPLVAMMMA